ncbi:MAG: cyclic nucleotide-binding domain-containing protein [Chloroflexota bacterium]
MVKETLATTLRANPWFQALSPDHFQKMVDIATEQHWDGDVMIFREGEQGKYLHLILEGQVALEIYVPNHGRVTMLTLGPDDIFGWSAVLPVVGTRTASARAVHSTRTIAFDSQALREACEADHELGFHVYRRLTHVIAGRLSATRLQLLDMYAHERGYT